METNFRSKRDERWIRWMEYGRRLGCHQMPERSVFIRGYQFPVCARCMGVIPASFVAVIVFFWYKISVFTALILCAVMFLDWFIQQIGIRPSTNLRRFITGLIGGYGFMSLQMYAYWGIYILVRKIILNL